MSVMESPGSCFSPLEPKLVSRCCCSSSDSCCWMQGLVTWTCWTFSCPSLRSKCWTLSCPRSRSWQQIISLEVSWTSFSVRKDLTILRNVPLCSECFDLEFLVGKYAKCRVTLFYISVCSNQNKLLLSLIVSSVKHCNVLI